METKRRALGRGLEQLFNSENLDINQLETQIVESASRDEIVDVKLTELRSNPYQPRKVFDEEALNELAQSIKENGVFQPIIIKKSIKGFEIVAGERRVRASIKAGLETIPAIIRDFTDEEMMQIALLENLQRENLNAIEEAEAYRSIIQASNLTQEQLAQKLGKSRSHVTNMLGILRLPSNVQHLVLHNKISMGHARVLSKLEDTEQVEQLAHKIVEEDISVRLLEKMVSDDYKRIVPMTKHHHPKDQQYDHVENFMAEKLGTKVIIANNKIHISFSSANDLNRILDIIKIDINE